MTRLPPIASNHSFSRITRAFLSHFTGGFVDRTGFAILLLLAILAVAAPTLSLFSVIANVGRLRIVRPEVNFGFHGLLLAKVDTRTIERVSESTHSMRVWI
jgi:hypothetical protein